jgi:hypothetical protein
MIPLPNPPAMASDANWKKLRGYIENRIAVLQESHVTAYSAGKTSEAKLSAAQQYELIRVLHAIDRLDAEAAGGKEQ